MSFVIVTGMSGAGKSTALKIFEDMGFFCVDNLPISLINKFADLTRAPGYNIHKIALGIDIRSGQVLGELENILSTLSINNYKYKILFLDANDEVLIKRFKETRRKHPLAAMQRVDEGIRDERELIAFLRKRADYIIDTSFMLTRDLKLELEEIFTHDKKFNNLYITILSFGYKHGLPSDVDLLFDVRFIPNPFYIDELKSKTGMDQKVKEYVMSFEEARTFLAKLEDLLKFLIPNFVREGKNHLVIGIGCTGGKHRSVVMAGELYKLLSDNSGYGINIQHRDVSKL